MANDDAIDLTCPLEGNSSAGSIDSTIQLPRQIGRYRVERLLGKGGFGLVYLAHDEQLSRPVAIKVPHADLLDRPDVANLYVAEARTVANLDHPNIVPVHDVGSTTEITFFAVSKYVDGADLATVLKDSRLSHSQAVEIVATVAEALHHAHRQGLVHRDIKPGNILIDKSGKPFVVDFGLALREQDVGKGSSYRKSRPRAKPKIDEFLPVIDQILVDDRRAPKKQRHTAWRIFERLRDEYHFSGKYTIVKDAVRVWKQSHQEVFLPLIHPPGEAQVDFGEATIRLAGQETKVALFVMTLPYSGAIFIQAFPRECTETFLEGHRRAFEYLGGVPRRISYDNSAIAVIEVLKGRERKLTKRIPAAAEPLPVPGALLPGATAQ
jgi:serine/threonine protein kinase